MQPILMENGIILDSRITAPESLQNARLNNNKTWCAKSDDALLTIDLGRIMTITGLALQGNSCLAQSIFFKYAIKDVKDITSKGIVVKREELDKVDYYRVSNYCVMD